jgi:hypothetical protein
MLCLKQRVVCCGYSYSSSSDSFPYKEIQNGILWYMSHPHKSHLDLDLLVVLRLLYRFGVG